MGNLGPDMFDPKINKRKIVCYAGCLSGNLMDQNAVNIYYLYNRKVLKRIILLVY